MLAKSFRFQGSTRTKYLRQIKHWSCPLVRVGRVRIACRRSGLKVLALRNFDWPQALLLDAEGVLVEGARDVRRPALNTALKKQGDSRQFSVIGYGELLASLSDPTDPLNRHLMLMGGVESEAQALLEEEDRQVSTILQAAQVEPRAGVVELIHDALTTETRVVVVNATHPTALTCLLATFLGDQDASRVHVSGPPPCGPLRSPPHPAALLQVARDLNLETHRCVVVDHCREGVIAARCAGMRVLAVPSEYTEAAEMEDLADALFFQVGGDEFRLDDLTTPGEFWLNPPLPRDVFGNKYVDPTEESVFGLEEKRDDNSCQATVQQDNNLGLQEVIDDDEFLMSVLDDMDPL